MVNYFVLLGKKLMFCEKEKGEVNQLDVGNEKDPTQLYTYSSGLFCFPHQVG